MGIQGINQAFPGFRLGDFAVLQGHPFLRALISKLCVHCQLSREKGGLDSSVIFIDGGNTFNPYSISATAQELDVDPRSTLKRVFVSRAFTAYQLSTLVLETLEDALKRYSSKLILISEIIDLFLDRDVPTNEASGIFRKMMVHLVDLALRRNIIVAATCSNNERSKRLVLLETILLERAGIIAKVTESKGRLQLTIQSNRFPKLLTFDVSHSKSTLEKFVEA